MGVRGGVKIGCCYGCEERHHACHDTCEKYINEKAILLDEREAIKAERNKTKAFDSYHFAATKKAMIKKQKNKMR